MFRENNSLNLPLLASTVESALAQNDIRQAIHCIQLIFTSQSNYGTKINVLQNIAKNYINISYLSPDDRLVYSILNLPVNDNFKICLLVNIAKAYADSKHILQVCNIVKRIEFSQTQTHIIVPALQEISKYCSVNNFPVEAQQVLSIVQYITINNVVQCVNNIAAIGMSMMDNYNSENYQNQDESGNYF